MADKFISNKDKIILFRNTKIRRIWNDDEWYYSAVDIVEALTESPNPRQYWRKIKDREFPNSQFYPIWRQLRLESLDGKSTILVHNEAIIAIYPKKIIDKIYLSY